MAYVMTDDKHYGDIADAIRERLDDNVTMTPSEMMPSILAIPSIDGLLDGSVEEIVSNALSIREGLLSPLKNLVSINFPLITELNNSMFKDFIILKTINFPSVENIGDGVFYGCSSLETAIFPKATVIGGSAFRDCGVLEIVSFPLVTEIGVMAFNNCWRLISIELPLIKKIWGSTFFGCFELLKADFSLVTEIGMFAFQYAKLETLIIRTPSICTLDMFALSVTAIEGGTGYIYVPAALVDGYKIAANWSVFASQIRAIEDYPEITGGAE